MLEAPTISPTQLIDCLHRHYALTVAQVTFLPLGADLNTAVFRVVAEDGMPYFLKLRSGLFDEASVTLPSFLSEQGVKEIISPIPTVTGQLSADLDAYKVMLYPFVEGQNGYAVALSAQQWAKFGAALKQIHGTTLPTALRGQIRRDGYAPHWRDMVMAFLVRVEAEHFAEPVASRMAALLREERGQILDLVDRSATLAGHLQAEPTVSVLCHSDLHAGNILATSTGEFYIVDWDEPIWAPKERDLMFIGGGQGYLMAEGGAQGALAEEALFYAGYGQTEIDQRALAYYRYERIIVDIGEYCKELLLTDEGGADREQSFGYCQSNFLPGGTIEVAYRADKSQA